MSASPLARLRAAYPSAKRPRQAVNAAIRAELPGGAALLDALALATDATGATHHAGPGELGRLATLLESVASAGAPASLSAPAAGLAKKIREYLRPDSESPSPPKLQQAVKALRDAAGELVLQRYAGPAGPADPQRGSKDA